MFGFSTVVALLAMAVALVALTQHQTAGSVGAVNMDEGAFELYDDCGNLPGPSANGDAESKGTKPAPKICCYKVYYYVCWSEGNCHLYSFRICGPCGDL